MDATVGSAILHDLPSVVESCIEGTQRELEPQDQEVVVSSGEHPGLLFSAPHGVPAVPLESTMEDSLLLELQILQESMASTNTGNSQAALPFTSNDHQQEGSVFESVESAFVESTPAINALTNVPLDAVVDIKPARLPEIDPTVPLELPHVTRKSPRKSPRKSSRRTPRQPSEFQLRDPESIVEEDESVKTTEARMYTFHCGKKKKKWGGGRGPAAGRKRVAEDLR